MPVSSMAFAFGLQMLIIDVMRYFGIRAPIRISSLPRGSLLRPGIYSVIEDVIAVDGSGGTEFRQRLNLRYQASHYFRQMLHRLTLFWAFGSLGMATATTVIIFTTTRDVAYVVSLEFPLTNDCQSLLTDIIVRVDNSVCLGSPVGANYNELCPEAAQEGGSSMAAGAREALNINCQALSVHLIYSHIHNGTELRTHRRGCAL
jgi:hypothetical protein